MSDRLTRLQRHLGLRVKELRVAKGLTQEAFAARVDMLTPNYARIEQGRQNLTLDTLVRVADALGVDVRDLFVTPSIGPSQRGRPKGEKAS